MAAVSASSSVDITVVEGPALSLINKRLRALRKKLNRITMMEESLSQGKTLNKEQEETLRSKSTVLAGIDELEKLRQPLSQAVDQEIQLAIEKNQKPDAQTSGLQKGELSVGAGAEGGSSDVVSGVPDLLNLLYFGTIFDVKTLIGAHDNMLTRTHERNCCLSYDYVTDDDAEGDPLKEWDLDLISMLGGLLISRPVNSSSSHKNALQKCEEHAKLWLANSDLPIDANSNITYAYLREKLNKIMASEYFTTTPEIKASDDVAAAAAGNYASFQAPLHGSVIPPSGATVSVEGSHEEYQQQEEQAPNFYGEEIYEEDNSPIEETHQGGGGSQEDNAQVQAEPDTGDDQKTDQNRDVNFEESHPYRNPYNRGRRGGSHGGGRQPYTNSRGRRGGSRGGYQNGYGQFYDQPGGYYPRNNHFRGRGGRGMPGHYAPVGHVEAAS